MSEAFKVGDVVQLKSGGVKMVIRAVNSADSVVCQWLTKDGLPQVAEFPPVMLRAAEP